MAVQCPDDSEGKESACNVGDLGLIPGLGQRTHSSILAWRIPMDRRAWQAIGHGVAESGVTEQLSTAPDLLGFPGGARGE